MFKKIIKTILVLSIAIMNLNYKNSFAQSYSQNTPNYLDDGDLYNTALPIGYNNNEIENSIQPTYNKSKETEYNYKKIINNSNNISSNNNSYNKDLSKKQLIKKASLKQFRENQKIQSFTKSDSKTVGSYLGVDFINTALRYEQINTMPANYDQLNYFNSTPRERTEKQYKSKDGFAIKYLYAVNFNGIFLAPEIFYHHINIKHYDSKNELENTDMTLPSEFGYRYNKIHNQYGAKLNLGYDINSDFALYGFVGISRIKYSNLYSLYPYYEGTGIANKYNIKDVLSVYNGTATAPIYGFGGKIKLSKRFYLNGEYMISDFYSKTNSKKIESYEALGCSSGQKYMCNNNRSDAIKLNNFIRIFKIGITFNF
jgi:hypothetical protein